MGTPLSQAVAPNDLWCADFKGEFKLGNGRYCYPLTVTDQASRYLLVAEALETTKEAPVIEAFIRLFRDRGLPQAIRSDNGVPFASPNGLYNLSRLSVWWLRLGIAIERIRPGRPQENGRHERMHRTLKQETARPPAMNALQQQARFDAFISEFNDERPHEALAMKLPAERYAPSSRPYHGLPDLTYPFHDKDIMVTACGRICMHRKKINISTVLAGQRLGIKEVDDGIWLISFMQYDLGYIDLEQRTLQTIDSPFGTRLSPMSQVRSVTHVSGMYKNPNGSGGGKRTPQPVEIKKSLPKTSSSGVQLCSQVRLLSQTPYVESPCRTGARFFPPNRGNDFRFAPHARTRFRGRARAVR